ncbi:MULTISPECIES: iron-siderophore ABC transporter substrate-binding protein [unclassified Microbacterium]|uniref:iron-siderophore ABC transporter substrate-binding protein n=1 Tax=unclassified Microbacterium TaxID=2609290 RepID=UPI000428A239|nr:MULTISPECIES: iron-siderophore ABC transporter substrate-binding protein [unclassified Microbacterium]PQZ55379.1 iron-siderophore ABC transporter substrate-binding protein [Microbacterium sp. MYb43]PQZ76395.1 iron-siderophore ABC transporter substrate-binding protein [Microbacterium sp. MYb40]PRB21159.1 iron-siderophore ABC transporter substrate-binding protein [Microbacterium sp. MYb54]PRB26341.1 iron-siderophore ABC transporter substrate-binding protein [Microbacterium sp. MYb50]PRB66980.
MRTSRILAIGAAAALAVGLSACASSAPQSSSTTGGNPASDDAFPVTVEHIYGETTITEKPERVATVAWANHEVPLALGIVPVGMSKAAWGDDDDNGVLPWVEEKLDELGAETPVLFDETDGIDYEAVADTEPDVILAAYSGLTQEEYDTLSKIAPVIAYPEVAWGTSVNDMIEMDSKALGLEDEGKALIKQLDADAQKALEANSVLKDKKVLFSYIDPTDLSQIGYYTAIDTRPGYLHGLGLPFPSIVEENKDSNEFYLTVSSEEAQKFDDVDLFITYGDESIIPLLQADPLLSKIPAIAEGRIAILPDASPIAASANPSPLSIPWGLSDYFAILAAPLSK